MATAMMAYAQLEIDNSSTCIPRLCRFSITRLALQRLNDTGDSNAIVVAVKIQSNKRTFRCCEIPLQQDGTLDAPVNLQYFITYPHYFKRDINHIHVFIQRRKNRPMIGYKTLARGEVNLNEVIQQSRSMDLPLYVNVNEKTKQTFRPEESSTNEVQNRPIGYVSILSLSSTIPDESDAPERTNMRLTSHQLATKHSPFEKSFNDHDEEGNSELEDSDLEFTSKNKQKFNPNVIRNKLIQMFKRKCGRSATSSNKNPNSSGAETHQYERFLGDPQSDTEEDLPSDISDSTIPVDQWSIESVPKPGFTPVEHLQVLKCREGDGHPVQQLTHNNDSPFDSAASDFDLTDDRRPGHSQPLAVSETKLLRPSTTIRDGVLKQFNELYTNDRLPESVIFLSASLNQPFVTASKLKELNLSVVSLSTLSESKAVLNNSIQRIQKCGSEPVIRIVLLGDDTFVNLFLQSYVECLTSRPHEYMAYFRFYFIPLGTREDLWEQTKDSVRMSQLNRESRVFSYLAKYLGSLDPQYEALFGINDSPHEISDLRDLSQKMARYLKTSQRTLSLPVGEVMLNRKGKLSEEDSAPTFLPFFCYVRLGTFASNESHLLSMDDSALLSAAANHPSRERKDSSDDENNQTLCPNSPQSKITSSLIKPVGTDDLSTSPFDLSIDYWTSTDGQKDKKDGTRTIKSSLKSNIRMLAITRQPMVNSDGKVSPSLTITYVTGEKKQTIMKFAKKLKDGQTTKMIESQTITGINRLVCTSKSQSVELKVNVDGQEWNNVKFFQISSQWHTHIKYFPLALFSEIPNNWACEC